MNSPDPAPRRPRRVLRAGSQRETRRIADVLRTESAGGLALIAAAVVGIVWANSPAGASYEALRDFTWGPEALHLHLSVAHWASDGLLALFFFVVGLELKREFVAGDLRNPRQALVPVVAAIAGVIVPAALYALVAGPTAARGWAIPTATDIAFAVAVLGLVGSQLPSALRTFLLTLAVVDDLIAIGIIAVFFTDEIAVAPLVGFAVVVAVFAWLVQRFRHFFDTHPVASWVILVPIGALAWGFLHASGLHATIAGVALGLCVPVRRRDPRDRRPGLAETLEHRVRPLSAGVAVPVFALFSAGVSVDGPDAVASAVHDPVTLGVVVGLVVGKPLGILAGTWLLTRLTGAELDSRVRWIDLTGVAILAGIGFTVSLLVSELSFPAHLDHLAHAKLGVLAASVLAAALACVVLAPRNRHYARRG